MTDSRPFALHRQLAADCHRLGDLPVSQLLLMDDSRYPWCILVPRHNGLEGLHDLPPAQRAGLLDEISRVSRAILELCGSERINVGALGNLVPQLHVHVVGRRVGDAAWPGPVWGFEAREPYAPGQAVRLGAGLWRRLSTAAPAPRQ